MTDEQLPMEGEAPKEPKGPKSTEADLLAMLRQKLSHSGNGGAGEYAVLAHVRNDAGFTATRTFDAVAVSLWPSRGFTLHCYEVKCSRSDWLRELKEPAKAEAAAKYCDKFSIVAADASIVVRGELPPTWGLLVAGEKGLRTVVAAPMLPGADPSRAIPRSFLIPLLRSAGAVAATPKEVLDARAEGYAQGVKAQEWAFRWEKETHAALAAAVKTFEEAAGVRLSNRHGLEDPGKVGRAVKAVLESEKAEQRARTQLELARQSLLGAVESITVALGESGGDEPGLISNGLHPSGAEEG